MERCPNCGNKLSNIDVLCPRCGTVVEVIQIKSSIATDAVSGAAAADNKIAKKDFSQSFVVYNEDVPAVTESERESGAALQADPGVESLSGGVTAEAVESILKRYHGQPEADGGQAAERKDTAQSAQSGDDNDFSPRYIENIMNMNLPEIDDLQNFDPDEFMREYKRSKRSSSPAEAEAPLRKRWLEIEETDDAEAAAPPAAESPVAEAEETAARHRYRASFNEERRGDIQRERQSEPAPRPAKPLKPKKSNAALSVLLWVLVTAAFFFSFIFFDKYVQKAYGSYGNLIYSITNGKVDLGSEH